jgi:hypothetical protein
VTNNSSEFVTITKLPTALLSSVDNGGAFTNAVGTDSTPCSAAADVKLPQILAPGDPLKCTLTIPDLGPAHYQAQIDIDQVALKVPTSTLNFAIRRPWYVAMFWIFLGSVVGGIVAYWRNSMRVRLGLLERAYELRSAYTDFLKTLSPKLVSTKQVATEAEAALSAQIQHLRHARDATDETALATHAQRLVWLKRFAALETRYLSEGKPADANDTYSKAARALGSDAADAAGVDTALNAFEDALDAANPPSKTLAMTNVRVAKRHRRGPTDKGKAWWIGLFVRSGNILVSVLSIAITTIVGVGALWAPSSAWGSMFDITVALLAGASATAGGTVMLSDLTKSYAPRLSMP